jgi:hypothetical protein
MASTGRRLFILHRSPGRAREPLIQIKVVIRLWDDRCASKPRTRGPGAGGQMRGKIDACERTRCKAAPMRVPIKHPEKTLAYRSFVEIIAGQSVRSTLVEGEPMEMRIAATTRKLTIGATLQVSL